MNGRSKQLNELYKLREKLDRNAKDTPDYHITTNKDYQIHRKVVVNDNRRKTKIKPKSKTKTDNKKKSAVTENIRSQIKELFRYGYDLHSSTQVSVSSNSNQKCQVFKFHDEFQLADTLSEYSKGADMINFIVDIRNDTIFWSERGTKSVRIIRK
jgi:hypothetical protein